MTKSTAHIVRMGGLVIDPRTDGMHRISDLFFPPIAQVSLDPAATTVIQDRSTNVSRTPCTMNQKISCTRSGVRGPPKKQMRNERVAPLDIATTHDDLP
jgi:hypothetical protein